MDALQRSGQYFPNEEKKCYLAAIEPLPNNTNVSPHNANEHLAKLREIYPYISYDVYIARCLRENDSSHHKNIPPIGIEMVSVNLTRGDIEGIRIARVSPAGYLPVNPKLQSAMVLLACVGCTISEFLSMQ